MADTVPTFPPSRPLVLLGASVLFPVGVISLLLGYRSMAMVAIAGIGFYSLIVALRTVTQRVTQEHDGLRVSDLFGSRHIPFCGIRYLHINNLSYKGRVYGRRIIIRSADRSVRVQIANALADQYAATWLARAENAIFVDQDKAEIRPPRAGLTQDSLRALRKAMRHLVLQHTFRSAFMVAVIAFPLALLVRSQTHLPSFLAIALAFIATTVAAIISCVRTRNRTRTCLGGYLTGGSTS